MSRTLTKNEQAVLYELRTAKALGYHKTAFCTVIQPLVLTKGDSDAPDQNVKDVVVKVGSTLKIVMVLGFGDIGLADDLNAESGYDIRVDPEAGQIVDIRSSIEPTWPVHDDKMDRIIESFEDEDGGLVP